MLFDVFNNARTDRLINRLRQAVEEVRRFQRSRALLSNLRGLQMTEMVDLACPKAEKKAEIDK